DAGQRNRVELLGVRVREATLGQAPINRHLAALEAVDRHAGARLLTLDAAAAGLARSGADAAPDALARMCRALLVTQFVEFHRSSPRALPYFSSTTRTRWETAAIMPRTEGVSSRVRRRCILLRPRPSSVARCSFGR